MLVCKRAIIWGMAVLACAALLCPAAAHAQRKELAQLQRDMDLLRESVRELQRSVDEKHAVLRTLIEQSLDSVNKLNTTMGSLQKSVQDVQANTGARMDSMSTQVQALADNFDEVKTRLTRLTQQFAELQSVVQTLDAKVAGGAPIPGAPGAAPVPGGPPASPQVLYDSALRDFTAGNYDLAWQQFQDYLKYFPDTELASNSQFYLGEILYRQKKFPEAIAEYTKVLENYSASNKLAAARLKKGYAHLELGQRASALRELREVSRRHPGTDEARLANAKLRELGAGPPKQQQ
jgi:tol-pal system protein YbgF